LTRLEARAVLAIALAAAPAAALADAALLDAIARRIGTPQVVRGDFVQEKRLAALRQPFVSEGRLVFSRSQGVLWHIDRPYRASYLLTETAVVERLPDGTRHARAARDSPGLAQVGRVFRATLGADTTALAEYFTVDAQGTPARWRLTLTPRADTLRQAIRDITVAGAQMVEEISITEASGDRTVIRFMRLSASAGLTAGEAVEFETR
jgi:outer membrane lipoprotein-sorting protein